MTLRLSSIKQAILGINFSVPLGRRFGLPRPLLPDLADGFRKAICDSRPLNNMTDQVIYHGLIGRSRTLRSLEVEENLITEYMDSVAGNAAIDVLGTLTDHPALKFVLAGQTTPAILGLGRNIFREYSVSSNYLNPNTKYDDASPAGNAAYWTIGNWVDRSGLLDELKGTGMFEGQSLRTAAAGIKYEDQDINERREKAPMDYFTSFIDLFVDPFSDASVERMVDKFSCSPFTYAAKESAFNIILAFRTDPGISRLLRAYSILGCSPDISQDLVDLAETICNILYEKEDIEMRTQEAVFDQLKIWASGLDQ